MIKERTKENEVKRNNRKRFKEKKENSYIKGKGNHLLNMQLPFGQMSVPNP